MREVEYKDDDGRKFRVIIPDDAPEDHAFMGVRRGPPDLSVLRLPLDVEVRLNNALYNRGLLSKADVRRRRAEMIAVWQSVFNVDTGRLVQLYEGVE